MSPARGDDRPLGLFEGWGIEIECMLVDAASGDVRPQVDEVLRHAFAQESGVDVTSAPWIADTTDGAIAWSNELVAHVLEFKTDGPVASLAGVAESFRRSQCRADAIAREHLSAQLAPGAMHPWMDPTRETVLWPHENADVYREFDRLFDCRRHGWANLQSVHLNLPFRDEEEFGRLHAAVRIVLPLIPALAASSPWMDGRASDVLDNRLEVYRTNAAKVGALTGAVVPEPVFDRASYQREVFDPIDAQLVALGASADFLGVEWTNARGAIARFDRMAIEIRLIDAQEHAGADLAVCAAITGLVRGLVEERWSSAADQRALTSGPLVAVLADATRRGPEAPLGHTDLARLFGCDPSAVATCGDLLARCVPQCFAGPAELEPALEVVLSKGTLAQRMRAALAKNIDPNGQVPRAALREQLFALARCLRDGRAYLA